MNHTSRHRASTLTAALAAAVLTSMAVGPSQSEAASNALTITVPPIPVVVTNAAANAVQVAGNVKVTNLPAVQPVSGTVTVGNLPAVQKVEVTNLPTGGDTSGTVQVSNFPATQDVTGTVSVANLPTVQKVEVVNPTGGTPSGPVAISNFPATQQVTGTVAVNEIAGGIYLRSVSEHGENNLILYFPHVDSPVKATMQLTVMTTFGGTPFVSMFLSGTTAEGSAFNYLPVTRVYQDSTSEMYASTLSTALYLPAGDPGLIQIQAPGRIIDGTVSFNGVYLN